MSTQPIALPSRSSPRNHISNSNNADYIMSSGSYTGSNGNGSFNPASYTRHFLGSPISWRSTSFGLGVRFQGSPMEHFIGSPEQKPSLDSDVRNALSALDRESEFCRDYSCCGMHLNDLHALLEHFEEVHVVVIDPTAPQAQAQLQIPFNPQVVSTLSSPGHAQGQQMQQQQQQLQQQHSAQSYGVAFDPDEMDLEGPPSSGAPSLRSSPSSGAPTPPDTPITTPSSAYPSPGIPCQQPAYYLDKSQVQVQTQLQTQHLPHSPYVSQPPSPNSGIHQPVAAFDTKTLIRRSSSSAISTTPSSLANANTPVPTSPIHHQTRPQLNLNLTSAHVQHTHNTHSPLVEAFNYGRYGESFVGMPGSNMDSMDTYSSSMLDAHRTHNSSSSSLAGAVEECVPPALLFSNSATPESTPSTSRVPSPHSQAQQASANGGTSPTSPSAASGPVSAGVPSVSVVSKDPNALRLSSSVSRPATSLLLSKPFKCPKPNCNKSYKQANGLKYHMTHGSCNFAPPKDLEHVQALLERKRRDRAAAAAAGGYPESSDASQPSTPLPSNPSTPTSPYPDLQISDAEMREVEREAERRLRPFACGVGDCQRRYKNMNGLRYHYQHSGEHGAVGLALLASGVHECLGNNGSSSSASNSREASAVRGDREGRKIRVGGSAPGSRSGSLSRTGTPVPAVGMGPLPNHTQQYVPPSQPPQYQNQIAYQQRFAEHQRAQYAQQQQFQQQGMIIQQPQQYAAVLYPPASAVGMDVAMSG
ncbi:hypothetical protein F5146DRAFT_1142116 [Armillaria mellea]|nr:hypothetical protein F5146DRAFT_1142116 [Armillaria mellea]